MELSPPRGTEDLLPPASGRMNALYERAHEAARRFGFRYVPMNTPPRPADQSAPGAGPMSPWLPVWLAPLLLLLLAAVGAAWAFAVLPEAVAGSRWMSSTSTGTRLRPARSLDSPRIGCSP